MKTSKIKDIKGNGSWTHQEHGIFYSHEYTFEDGVTITANSKSADTIHKIGDIVEYEITKESDQYGKSGKVTKPQDQSNQTKPQDDGLQGVKIGHAITNAVTIATSNRDKYGGNADATTSEFGDINELHLDIKTYAKMILKIGEELNAEISKQSNIATGPTQTAPSHTQPVQPPLEDYRDTADINDNDIPF